jgi:hypothetical protein
MGDLLRLQSPALGTGGLQFKSGCPDHSIIIHRADRNLFEIRIYIPIVRRTTGQETFLATAVFVLGIAVPAIHWSVFSGFERNFALLFTIRTDGFMHLSRTSVVSSILKTHVLFLLDIHDINVFTDIDR